MDPNNGPEFIAKASPALLGASEADGGQLDRRSHGWGCDETVMTGGWSSGCASADCDELYLVQGVLGVFTHTRTE